MPMAQALQWKAMFVLDRGINLTYNKSKLDAQDQFEMDKILNS